VHPCGVVPLGEIVVKKRWKNGVAVAPMPYAAARDDFFFNRCKETWMALWPQGRAPKQGRRPRPPCARACGRA
jgi:hypothetical protein